MVFTTIAMTGCKKDDELTASIKPAPGWERIDWLPGPPPNAYYDKNSHGTEATIWLSTFHKKNPFNDGRNFTADEYVAFMQEKISREAGGDDFSATSYTKVGGKDAVEFTYTVSYKEDPEWNSKYRVVYILLGKNTYSIDCYALVSDYDTVAADFQSMIDSYRLK